MTTRALFRQDAYLRECESTIKSVTESGIELDQTVFYPLGGGQAADTGVLRLADGTVVPIVDARKSRADGATPDDVVHQIEPACAPELLQRLRVGEPVLASIDWERRFRHMRFHTATHLLCALIERPVDGCSITRDYARLDLVMTDPLDKDLIEDGLNRLIRDAHRIATRWVSEEELLANPQLVKSMSVAPPMGFGALRLLDIEGVDLQACGGTHVQNTSEIGAIRVAKIEKKSARTRRVTIEFLDA